MSAIPLGDEVNAWAAMRNRHPVRYAIGESERYRAKRATSAERETPTSAASPAMVHG